LVEDYLKLCRDPARDLQRWLAEDDKRAGIPERRIQPTIGKEYDHAHASTVIIMADAAGLRRDALPQLRSGLDAHRQGGRSGDGLSSQSRAGAGGNDRLRSLRGQGAETGRLASDLDRATPDAWRAASADGSSISYEAEAAAISGLFRMKLAGLRRRLRPSEIPAAVRALQDEKRAALRAVKERREIARFGERQAQKQARAPPEAKPQ
jgi:hypothetical protein